jgi:hypothetical protein
MWLGDFEEVDKVEEEIHVVGQTRRGQNFQQERVARLAGVADGLEPHLVEALLHGRGVRISCAVNDV